MQMTVLGCWSPFPAAGEACLGYLLEHDGYRVLLECGSGVLGQLVLHMDLEQLDGVVLSHFHADHAADALILRYAVHSLMRMDRRKDALKIFAIAEPAEEFARLSYGAATEPVSVLPGEAREIGPFTFQFVLGQHALPCLGMRISAGGRTLAYTGDSGYAETLLKVAEGVDVLLAEASLRQEDDEDLRKGHMTGGQAGTLARAAGAKRLLLTHFHPLLDPRERQREAMQHFNGPVEVVRSGARYFI